MHVELLKSVRSIIEQNNTKSYNYQQQIQALQKELAAEKNRASIKQA